MAVSIFSGIVTASTVLFIRRGYILSLTYTPVFFPYLSMFFSKTSLPRFKRFGESGDIYPLGKLIVPPFPIIRVVIDTFATWDNFTEYPPPFLPYLKT